uniref:hypothetical protein n=1 Tax=Gelidibacter sp. TaxID=2018083 RepID=UPI00404A5FD6
MNTLKNKLFTTLLLVIVTSITYAQNQSFWIHTDHVKPAKQADYEKVTKDFVDACKKHDLKGMDFSTARIDDGSYISITPITNMADFDTNPLAPLAKKMGEDNFRALFARFNECYDKHGDHVVHLINSLSYMPEGETVNTPGQDYRKWHFLHVSPSNATKLRDKIAEITALYKKKGAKEYVRIYRSGFGIMGDYFIAVISAKDGQSYEKTSDETEALLGDEGKKLFAEMFVLLEKYDVKSGWMRPDLGYIAKQ